MLSIPTAERKDIGRKDTPRILIGCPTYPGHEYCLPEFIRSLQRLTYPNKDIYFVDDSPDQSYQKKLQQLGFRCGWVDTSGKAKIDKVIAVRNRVREEFLAGGYDYLFCLDTDVVVEKDAIEQLLSAGKDIVTGVYIIPKQFGEKTGFIPCVFGVYDAKTGGIPFPLPNREKARVMVKKELVQDIVQEICFAGLGFVLIKRNVLEQVRFRKEGTSDIGGEDVAFFLDARKNGFKAFVNSKPGSLHMVYPRGRKENQFFLFKMRPKAMGPKASADQIP